MSDVIDFPTKPPPDPGEGTIKREAWIESILALGRPVVRDMGTIHLLDQCRILAWQRALAWAEVESDYLVDPDNGEKLADVETITDPKILSAVAEYAGIVVELDLYLADLQSVRRQGASP